MLLAQIQLVQIAQLTETQPHYQASCELWVRLTKAQLLVRIMVSATAFWSVAQSWPSGRHKTDKVVTSMHPKI